MKTRVFGSSAVPGTDFSSSSGTVVFEPIACEPVFAGQHVRFVVPGTGGNRSPGHREPVGVSRRDTPRSQPAPDHESRYLK